LEELMDMSNVKLAVADDLPPMYHGVLGAASG
jgi:hypothetical protein